MSLKHSLTWSVILASFLVIPAKAGIFLALTATLLVACGDENFAYSVRCIKD